MNPLERLIVALDVDSEERALNLVDELKAIVKIFKVGSELFTSAGPEIIEKILAQGSSIFLDLKFHDIPNTVAKAARAAARLGVSIFNVHALGGYEMMKTTMEAVNDEAKILRIDRPKVLAVTILTSMDEEKLKTIGIDEDVETQVLRLANLAKDAGLDGVIASPREIKLIRKNFGKDFVIITPGVRPAWASSDDQRRIAAPREAIRDGADHIVVGRPIIEAKDPTEAARRILEEISEGE